MSLTMQRHASAIGPYPAKILYRGVYLVRLLVVSLGLFLLPACVPAREEADQLSLESGGAVVVLQRKAWRFTDGSPPALQLVYETNLSLDDSLVLMGEAQEVWKAFMPEVEERGFAAAILTPTRVTRTSSQNAQFHSYGFIASRDSSGVWHVR